jgi:uncharacterized protein YaaN involved in tellurite resistance
MPNTRDAGTDKPTSAHSPADNAVLDLTPPAPVGLVAPEEAERRLVIDPAAAARIDRLVATFVADLESLDVHSGEYHRLVAEVCQLGEREIVATAAMSGRLLSRPTDAMRAVLSGKAPIARRLTQLRRALEDLDPSKYDLARGGSRSFLGVIPMGDRLDDYFERYAGAQARIQGIVLALTSAREALIRDNSVIGQEQRSLWMEMETLRQYAYMAERLDAALELRIATLERPDPGGARVLREDILFPVRQRRQDLLTQLAVAMQGHAALRIVEQNNLAVIRSIQGATTTTVAALRTAAMVAQALGNQRQLVEQIARATEEASGMLDDTTRMLRDRAGDVELRAAAGGADVATLETAWKEVFTVLDQIDVYKRAALATMKVTASQLSTTLERARYSAERINGGPGLTAPNDRQVDPTSMLTLERPVTRG